MEKRDLIIEASIQVFTEKGIEKTKISDIAKAASIGQGTFYLYFPSKLAVMPAIAEVMVAKIEAGLKTLQLQGSLSQQLTQIIDVFFEITKQNKETFTLIYAGLTQTQHVQEWENMYEPIYSWFHHFLERVIETKTIKIEHLSKMLVGLIESTAEQVYLYDKEERENELERKRSLVLFLEAGITKHS
ncbi:TetR family transcriptional regulator [Alkalihalobacillus alcalophilus ATCC 27647 = CGMCC 1.3604]|uniref:TetR family transcriptional regulator n=1 Tax=Alkalihalobacillus alcalophilus ATCC 27647 = CGMCC 1.3604 TaxID=1218173 RepID=A0A094YWU7_ALKAL|nr:TetR family transcriptional regulator [Alkalihalobacillus alcalophilus]KGA98002.1 TetR family transcriptional regulator [Alkalihalobacillus alcalophilus ATCC 27647 = CGMCC 1.3604]MED1561876.1 TetR family transcriptional regulator [Alkalihalobacillus alcalophilus]THG90451.1 TetR family transcriptional regulator [Alkalihalobacillus alcalophilus ATCC 27647 = CGMCC 1.3604]